MSITKSRVLRDLPQSHELAGIAARIGEEVAAPVAREVDREARFPVEAFDALREARLLSVLVPAELGGVGASLADVARATEELSRHCASTGLIYAMHQIQVAVLARHGGTPFVCEYLRTLVRDELLIASATTEIGTGGDTRSSICAVERDGPRFRLTKQAPVISYGHHADAILATARRDPESPPNDQVIVLIPAAEYELAQTSVWDTLGFRGTCSDGFTLTATGHPDQILPATFADVSARTMLPITHVLWSSVWLGIADRAVTTVRSYLRAEARRQPGSTPPVGTRAAELVGLLDELAALVHHAVRDYEDALDDDAVLTSMRFAVRMNALKTTASVQAAEIVARSLTACGMAAYSETSPYSLGLALRDISGAAVMIHNDRIMANTAQMLLALKER